MKNAQNKLETISTGEVVKVASPDNLYQVNSKNRINLGDKV